MEPDPASLSHMFIELETLNAGIDSIRKSPSDEGVLEMVVCRPAPGEREVLAIGELDTAGGLTGDRWRTESRDPRSMLTLMNARAAAAVAGTRERWPLAGDQLFVDLNLSYENIPPGSLLSIGDAVVLEVTDLPHRGCGKFIRRFGIDASRFVNSGVGRELNLRGINARVVSGGVVRPGDAVVKA
jgi:hypothetical protein